MAPTSIPTRLDRPVDEAYDHVVGPIGAGITLVEYGSYACPHCRVANERIAELRSELGDRLRYVFRHRPIPGNDLARRAAELAERAGQQGRFWDAHVALMTRSAALTEDDLSAVAREMRVGVDGEDDPAGASGRDRARNHVDSDISGADRSGVRITPTFFINGRRYDGVWEDTSFNDALLGSLGHRVRAAALDFARWAPATGVLLVLASVLAVALTNSAAGASFQSFWQTPFGFTFDGAEFRMSILKWINDGLLTAFFLVVGLEIKREFTVGHLASRRSAALPIAAAIGGMIVPVLLYRSFVAAGPWSHGWGVPMATDTAFAVALIVMLGQRVPVELRIFLTAAAIVDDIGAIAVVALFYSSDLHAGWLGWAAVITAVLAIMNRAGVYRVAPYLLLGLALWACVHAGGVHATLAGVILAFTMPTREPPRLPSLMAQADAILVAQAQHSGDAFWRGPSAQAMDALDAIHDRLESPADRMLRVMSMRSNFVVLPVFALANAGVALSTGVIHGREPLMLAIGAGLVLGKPIGLLAASALAVRLGVAEKPAAYSWVQMTGAGALAGIGFTMSLFIAGEAFPDPAAFAAAKIAVFSASILAALAGVAVLWRAGRESPRVRAGRAGEGGP